MQFGQLRRRDVITLLGGAAAAPFTAHAQQPTKMRRIGVLMGGNADNPEGQERLAAFLETLQQLGWTDGHNLRTDIRWAQGDADSVGRYAKELVALEPDVILTSGTAPVAPLLRATRILPIVFASATDPVGAGFVESLARPGGNATGFMQFEYSLSGKLLELLKEIAPRVARAAGLSDVTPNSLVGQIAMVPNRTPSPRNPGTGVKPPLTAAN